jgi:type II secretory pathway component PulK
MTPELFWGAAYTNHPPGVFLRERFRNNNHVSTFNSGLVDLFAVMGTGRININTASAEVLQLVPGVDAMVAEAIVRGREGEDDGSGMFGPYRSVAQVFERVPEVNRGLMGVLSQYCDVRSRTFQIQVEAQIGGYRREFIAMVGCSDPRNIQLLTFYWK